MPIRYLSRLTAPERSERTNLHLGMALAVVAGALNAGGFLAVGQYTSHMTGIVSSVADNRDFGKPGPSARLGKFVLRAAVVRSAATSYFRGNRRGGQSAGDAGRDASGPHGGFALLRDGFAERTDNEDFQRGDSDHARDGIGDRCGNLDRAGDLPAGKPV